LRKVSRHVSSLLRSFLSSPPFIAPLEVVFKNRRVTARRSLPSPLPLSGIFYFPEKGKKVRIVRGFSPPPPPFFPSGLPFSLAAGEKATRKSPFGFSLNLKKCCGLPSCPFSLFFMIGERKKRSPILPSFFSFRLFFPLPSI